MQAQTDRISLLEEMYSGEEKILEIGPGDGLLIKKIHWRNPLAEIHVLDWKSRVLDNLPDTFKKKKFDLRELYLEKEQKLNSLPYESNYFDLVIFTEVLEHLTSPHIVLSEIHRILKEEGVLLISTPNVFCLGNRIGLLLGRERIFIRSREISQGFVTDVLCPGSHIAQYSRNTLRRLLETMGFVVEKMGGADFPVPRRLQRIFSHSFPNLANSIVAKAKKSKETIKLFLGDCNLNAEKKIILPGNRCINPNPDYKICRKCLYFHKEWLWKGDWRLKK